MTDETSKPASGTMPFSAEDAMAFMQKMWNPFALGMPGATGAAGTSTDPSPATPPEAAPSSQFAPALQAMMGSMMPGMMPFPNPAAMFAALDPVEIERKIGELRIIENWLTMSLNMTQMSIKTLELQHASLEAMRATHAPAKPSRREVGSAARADAAARQLAALLTALLPRAGLAGRAIRSVVPVCTRAS